MAEQFTPGRMNVNYLPKAGDRLQSLDKIAGTREKFDQAGVYKIDQLSYPIDLLTAGAAGENKSGSFEYGNNYVIFYVNVSDDSKLLRDPSQEYEAVPDFTPRQYDRLIEKNISAKQAAAASATEGAIVGGVGGQILGGNFKAAAKGAAVVGGASAIGVAAIASQAGQFTKQMKRLSTAIALHTPNALQARYGVNYEEAETAPFQMAMVGLETIGKAIADGVNPNKNVTSQTLSPGLGAAAAISLNRVPGKDSISAITGLAVNPKKEQIFRGVDFRTWTFDYQFFPRNEKEMQNVENIIYTFKLHMHPEFKDSKNFLYIYPSEFDIVHYNGAEENLHLPRHTSCVLTDMTINYTPQTQFTAFEGGAPTQINVSLTFKELIQMSKERIQEGF